MASTYLQVTTLIGYGSPNKAGTHDVHGAALGPDETAATREKLQWKYGEFEVPKEAYDVFGRAKEAGANAEKTWESTLEAYGKKYPEVSMHLGPDESAAKPLEPAYLLCQTCVSPSHLLLEGI